MKRARRALLPLLAVAAAAGAQAPPDSVPAAGIDPADVYRREVFRYQAGGRPDPFQPLIAGDEAGVRVRDLTLVSIIHNASSPRASSAVFQVAGDSSRVRLRTGQRLGTVTLLAIRA
ncbi:MAG TPA: hypothetical protein VFQ45_18840, partial [Longimicrobium sp.]|nr:hypothetical protein [Longimicrobium sp.]